MLAARSIKGSQATNKYIHKGAIAAHRLNALLSCSCANRLNPTVALIIKRVADSVAKSEPLQLVLHQRLPASQAARRAKIEHLLWNGVKTSSHHNWIDGADCSGWQALRTLLQQHPDSFRLTLLIDDFELLGVHDAAEWCQGKALGSLKQQLASWAYRVERAAEHYFRGINLGLSRVSNYIDLESFRMRRKHAAEFSNWAVKDSHAILESSMEMSYDKWGSSQRLFVSGLPVKTSQMLVCQELVSLAAQHALIAGAFGGGSGESARTDMSGCVLAWCASSEPSPMWPVILSNYDASGYAASVVV